MSSPRMRPPSVDALARSLSENSPLPQPLLVDAARDAIDEAVGDEAVSEAAETADYYLEAAKALAKIQEAALLQPVVNATGVLLHTNLGRAPWQMAHDAAYANLEFDLDRGERGSRQQTVGRLFAKLCDAERAIVVNNGAAAMMLVLAALASGRGVAVGRGELVEIGGGFRVPEVMEQSGAKLVEVGTTNRTRLADYEAALARPSADIVLCLKVHQSNYTISGFTELVEVERDGDSRSARGLRHRFGLAGCPLPVAGRRPPAVAGERAGGKAKLGSRGRLGGILRRQALGRPPSGHNLRKG